QKQERTHHQNHRQDVGATETLFRSQARRPEKQQRQRRNKELGQNILAHAELERVCRAIQGDQDQKTARTNMIFFHLEASFAAKSQNHEERLGKL
ncbi:hypothetical protein, partial [Pseudomonas ficuserectae]|uniref:hypothetical protein n=1 Tax=Pseudomonas ficuserectae TaxID=53410 RepID=UPI001C7FF2D5